MKHIGINAKVASHVFSLPASVEGTTVCLEIPLQPPPPPGDRHLATISPPPPGRPSRANPGVCKGGGGYICVDRSEGLVLGNAESSDLVDAAWAHLVAHPTLAA